MTNERIEMNVQMFVTKPQALALQAMFEYWNECGSIGTSRFVGFFADGDGNFQPNAKCTYKQNIQLLTDEMKVLAIHHDNDDGRMYDFDSIAWRINHPEKPESNVISITTGKAQDEE